MSLHERCFAFEADFVEDLRCLPMAVRRKLDLAGVKLKLSHWHSLDSDERARLLVWSDAPAAIVDLRQWLQRRTAELADGPARAIDPAIAADWQQLEAVPERLRAACEQLGSGVELAQWQSLDELQRFALVKLSHPGHEHRNLPRALMEFGLGLGCP
ncbi:nitrate reductase associated protein [Synechococcus sp. EJ6-Ellesmere]|uniref:nitrate reductase associated protein n=1 Tax=Synechococcus sp. EJ6-Ellesmere TaxID=2823734 RepID=UPI0020CEDB64|nr:nitrate reductase associated protein [Synechococcus sp. EJ6-Ellesmere]MCP9826146.1 nitrate reductase associated protein [Synechococcus sp. EJ6-Ellesmere]